VYEAGGTMIITHQQTSSTGSVQLISQDKQTEPEFMKYIKGVNINQNDAAYMKQHFDESTSVVE
jgi:hypothetical protein